MQTSALFTKKEVVTEEDHINSYYKANYAELENNLDTLKLKVDEDFYYQESKLTALIKKLDEQKDAYIKDLDNVEREYEQISKASKGVITKIEECNKKVEECKRIEKHFETFVSNVKALDDQLSKKKK